MLKTESKFTISFLFLKGKHHVEQYNVAFAEWLPTLNPERAWNCSMQFHR